MCTNMFSILFLFILIITGLVRRDSSKFLDAYAQFGSIRFMVLNRLGLGYGSEFTSNILTDPPGIYIACAH